MENKYPKPIDLNVRVGLDKGLGVKGMAERAGWSDIVYALLEKSRFPDGASPAWIDIGCGNGAFIDNLRTLLKQDEIINDDFLFIGVDRSLEGATAKNPDGVVLIEADVWTFLSHMPEDSLFAISALNFEEFVAHPNPEIPDNVELLACLIRDKLVVGGLFIALFSENTIEAINSYLREDKYELVNLIEEDLKLYIFLGIKKNLTEQ